MKEPNIAGLLQRRYLDTRAVYSASSLTLTALIVNLNIIHGFEGSNFRVIGPASFWQDLGAGA